MAEEFPREEKKQPDDGFTPEERKKMMDTFGKVLSREQWAHVQKKWANEKDDVTIGPDGAVRI